MLELMALDMLLSISKGIKNAFFCVAHASNSEQLIQRIRRANHDLVAPEECANHDLVAPTPWD